MLNTITLRSVQHLIERCSALMYFGWMPDSSRSGGGTRNLSF